MPLAQARTRKDPPRAIRTIAEETAGFAAAQAKDDRRRDDIERAEKLALFARQDNLAEYRPAARPVAEAPGVAADDVADADITTMVPPTDPLPDAASIAHWQSHAEDTDPFSPGRYDGWTIERQRLFFAAIADGRTVRTACGMVGMTTASAYALKRRHNGSAFKLGWEAASLFARDAVADELYDRAMNGMPESVILRDGTKVERTRYDNRLAMRLLDRLDRRADQLLGLNEGIAAPRGRLRQPHQPHQPRAIETVAGHWDEFLALVGTRPDTQAVATFVADRAPKTTPAPSRETAPEHQLVPLRLEEIEITPDLSDYQRLEVADALDEQLENHFFSYVESDALITDLPPPADFAGQQHGEWGEPGYARIATEAENAAVERWQAAMDRFHAGRLENELAKARADGTKLLERCKNAAELLVGPQPDAMPEPAGAAMH